MNVMSMNHLLPALQTTTEKLSNEFDLISDERRSILRALAIYVKSKQQQNETVRLNFICTHNSRRSHISQLWAAVSAHYYGIPRVETFSGGTEATAFNPRAVEAMRAVGFNIVKTSDGANPIYQVQYSSEAPPLEVFSKTYDHPANPDKNFAAVMTCSHADENCPFIPGSETRIPLTYDDPKDFDDTPMEKTKYEERVHQIGREILFAFSLLKINKLL